MKCDSIKFGGRKYRLRIVDLGGMFGVCSVASEHLNKLLIDDVGQYTSIEAELVDQRIFFFVPSSYFGLSNRELRAKIISKI